jgi:hypothetical protein
VQAAFHDSLRTLDSLPRILTARAVYSHFYEALPTIGVLFETGPSFSDVLATNTEFERIGKYVIVVIRQSFEIDFFIGTISADRLQPLSKPSPHLHVAHMWQKQGDELHIADRFHEMDRLLRKAK